jgi:GxxExxY protein
MKFDELSHRVIGCALNVHQALGPGLLESAYEQCLAYELLRSGIPTKVQMPLPVKYKEVELDCGYRVDLMVDDKIILELKTVDEIKPVHKAQLLTYMKLSGVRIGLLMNFNVKYLMRGIKRMVL